MVNSFFFLIRESVDSLCRDGANAQYMQYLSKSRITVHHKHAKSLFKHPGFLFECLCDQQDSYKWPKATQKTVKPQSVWGEFEAMKTLSGWEAVRCGEHPFRAKIKVSA